MLPVCSWMLVVFSLLFAQTPEKRLEFQKDIDLLVAASQELATAWPWQKEIPEIGLVTRHGFPIAPLLVDRLKFDSSNQWESGDFDLHVEQQIELALCRIAKVIPESGKTVFGVRSSDKENASVRKFWKGWVKENMKKQPAARQ